MTEQAPSNWPFPTYKGKPLVTHNESKDNKIPLGDNKQDRLDFILSQEEGKF